MTSIWTSADALVAALGNEDEAIEEGFDPKDSSHQMALLALPPGALANLLARASGPAAGPPGFPAALLSLAREWARGDRPRDALLLFDALVAVEHQEPWGYVTALWAVLDENTHLGIDEERARRYVALCAPHGNKRPEVHVNAMFVLLELGDIEGALAHLKAAMLRGYSKDRARTALEAEPLCARAREDPRFLAAIGVTMAPTYSRAFYERSSARYFAMRIHDKAYWENVSGFGVTIRTLDARSGEARVEFHRHASLTESVLFFEQQKQALTSEAYEVYSGEFLAPDLPEDPPPKRPEHVFLDDIDLCLRLGEPVSSAEQARLRSMGSPWAVLLELALEEGPVPTSERGEQRIAELLMNRSQWTDLYAQLLQPTELEGRVEFALGQRIMQRGSLVDAERHLARAHEWLPCTRTCAIHARALHGIAGREAHAFALASRYQRHGLMESIVADPRFQAFEAGRVTRGVRWTFLPAPCSDADVSLAERTLVHPFHPRFRAFALQFGAGTAHMQSPKTDRFIVWEHVRALASAQRAFRSWFEGHERDAEKKLRRHGLALDDLLPIAAPAGVAAYILMDAKTTRCLAWNHDALFELEPLSSSIDELIHSLEARKRWPFP